MTKNLFLFVIVFWLFCGCTETNDPVLPESNAKTKVSEFLIQVCNQSDSIDIPTIITVAERAIPTLSSTRSTIRTIKSIEPVSDQNGKILYYIVNFESNNGFVLISGNKYFTPILAYSEYGNFDQEIASKTGASIFIKASKRQLENIEELPDSIRQKYRAEWQSLDYSMEPESVFRTRAVDYDELQEFITAKRGEWAEKGYQVYNLGSYQYSQQFQGLPDYMKSDILDAADKYANKWCTNGDPRYSSYIIFKESTTGKYGPVCETQWRQTYGFNKYVPNQASLGCVTIAVGQILKYKRFPTDIPWDDMHNIYATDACAKFLYDLGLKLKIEFGDSLNAPSSGTDKKTITALKNLGFRNIQYDSFDFISAYTRLNYPSYMSGYDNDQNVGHAWVCDGFSGNTSRQYELWCIEDCPQGVQPRRFEKQYDGLLNLNSSKYYHMNLGWGGICDGFYTGSGSSVNIDEYKFSKLHYITNIIPSN